MITIREKDIIFSFIKENLKLFCQENFDGFSDFFDEIMAPKGFFHECGSTKHCITHPNFEGYVVKFTDTYEDFDYCEREYTNYLAAEERGLESYFPYTAFLGNFNEINFYIQEFAVCDPSDISGTWYKELRKSYDGEETEEDSISCRVWDNVDELDDDERIHILYNNDKLNNFLYEYKINDLHEFNFGYIDDRLVIIDFSGFGDRVINRGF